MVRHLMVRESDFFNPKVAGSILNAGRKIHPQELWLIDLWNMETVPIHDTTPELSFLQPDPWNYADNLISLEVLCISLFASSTLTPSTPLDLLAPLVLLSSSALASPCSSLALSQASRLPAWHGDTDPPASPQPVSSAHSALTWLHRGPSALELHHAPSSPWFHLGQSLLCLHHRLLDLWLHLIPPPLQLCWAPTSLRLHLGHL